MFFFPIVKGNNIFPNSKKVEVVAVNVSLKVMLLTKGRSQLWLARKVGVCEATLSKIICGWRNPPLELQEKIAHALECNVEQIFPAQGQRAEVGRNGISIQP
jgi:DNA-binding XRE family transcriptional regulator